MSEATLLNFYKDFSTKFSTYYSLVTSVYTKREFFSPNYSTALFPAYGSKSAIAILAPLALKNFPHAKPSPYEPPVIKTVRSFIFIQKTFLLLILISTSTLYFFNASSLIIIP